ncbi:chloramphenicol acetyltransferase [Clostridium tagluense]|uniref:chloramphenicol acetyltransferase n=1 Tax=Clostridium tagluense TaxID=360422 RepID=UPI001C6E56F6|nr:chloramphenicol acetyltransferase [Clostridium tagluense]MBW9157798.1 chloramphenicol acetyltransferase [Clostridium tagluense]WLC63774.1 chloramphenicol acetyltransferase [Clostridium tagluense]
MKFIDIENWERKNHYNYFKQLDYPHFNICGNVDITEFYRFIKEKENPFFISILYVVTKAANSIKEFRYRIREDKIVEHEIVSPSFTVMAPNEVFSFCTVKFIDEFNEFKINTSNEIERTKNNVSIGNEPGRDDLLYTTSIPWVSFTSITHPIQMKPVESVPIIAWGKYFEENGRIKLPLSVQVHHSLVDGVHVGQYFNKIQEILDNPVKYFH